MFQFVLIFMTVALEFVALKNIFSISLKEYQGFTTRFFSPNNSTISTNSVIFWIFISPIFSCLTYFSIWILNEKSGFQKIEFDKVWMVSFLFWLGEYLLIIFLGRQKLVNNFFIFFISLSSTLLNYYLSIIAFTGDTSDISPNASNTTFQFYLILGMFTISIIQVIYENDNYRLKRNKFILEKFNSYLSDFKILLDLDKQLLYLISSIILIEDFERPKFIRFIERITNSSTRNIAQNDSLDDSHSVFLLIEKIQELYNDSPKKGRWIHNLAFEYNHSEQYASDVEEIYNTIKLLDEKYLIIETHRSLP